MFSLTIVSPTYQTIDRAPIQSVDGPGVRNRGWIRPKCRGSAKWAAIDTLDGEVGRIVGWVDADADVSAATISSLFQGEPGTSLPSALRTPCELSTRTSPPW